MSVLARRKLTRVGERLRVAREELAAADAQLEFLEEEAADLHVRGLVSEQVLDKKAADEARRTADNARKNRDRLAGEVEKLQREADALLDGMARSDA